MRENIDSNDSTKTVSYKEDDSGWLILRLFRKIPLIIRAPALGFFIRAIGVFVWRQLAILNVVKTPAVPWAVAATVVFLLAYWAYFNGAFWPKATSR